MVHREQAGEVSDGHAFPQGREGCARREAEEKGVISKQGVSRIQSPGQRASAGCGLSWVQTWWQVAQPSPGKVPGFLRGPQEVGSGAWEIGRASCRERVSSPV